MHNERMAWVVWTISVLAYATAIMHRTSLGTLGIQTAQHFGTSIGIVSTFVMVQLAVYAISQAPVGVLIDRYGARAVLIAGSLIMTVAQTGMAFTDSLAPALVARVLLGIGDACMFGAVLRLIPAWFPAPRVPVLSQLSGLLGQLGQIAAVALLLPLHTLQGWTTTFLVAAICSLACAVGCALLVRDVPAGASRPTPAEQRIRDLPKGIVDAWRHPATRLGFFVHFTSGFSVNVFAMIWGIPWLIGAQQRTESEAAFLFSLTVLAAMILAPIIGWLTARHPLRRSNLALTVIGAHVAAWLTVLLWPGPAPWWLLVALTLAMAAGGPGTGIGFDYPRTLLPSHRLGAANGLVIAGSFTGATLCLLLMGAVLGWLAPDGRYTAEQLNLAMALQLPFFAVGIAGIYLTRHQLRTKMRAHGVVVPTWREVAARIRQSRR
ncbi:MAG: MFS transporter [Propionibacteriaceae bacterium]|nr:MFS transporter [Propionibacteriaceae bacterium]